jgi:hypothetical protein
VGRQQLDGASLAIILLEQRAGEHSALTRAEYVKLLEGQAAGDTLVTVEKSELVWFVTIVHQDRVE